MYIEIPNIPGIVLNTKEAIKIIKGPTEEYLVRALEGVLNQETWFGDFRSKDKAFVVEITEIMIHQQFKGSWFIVADLLSSKEVMILWSPGESKGYLWLGSPRQVNLLRKLSFKPIMGS